MSKEFIGCLIFIFNVFDGVVTSFVINLNDVVERNPIWDWLYQLIGNWFIIPKLAIVIFSILVLMRYWNGYRILRVAAIGLVVLYVFLAVYHTLFFNFIMRL